MSTTEIENNYYRNALISARTQLVNLVKAGKISNNVEIQNVIHRLEQAWRFRRYDCPKCKGPASRDCRLSETTFLYDWVCWKCGRFTTNGQGE